MQYRCHGFSLRTNQQHRFICEYQTKYIIKLISVTNRNVGGDNTEGREIEDLDMEREAHEPLEAMHCFRVLLSDNTDVLPVRDNLFQ